MDWSWWSWWSFAIGMAVGGALLWAAALASAASDRVDREDDPGRDQWRR